MTCVDAWEDLVVLKMTDDMWEDRIAWRARILVADPKTFGLSYGVDDDMDKSELQFSVL